MHTRLPIFLDLDITMISSGTDYTSLLMACSCTHTKHHSFRTFDHKKITSLLLFFIFRYSDDVLPIYNSFQAIASLHRKLIMN